jgi:hypothetical protein
MANYLLLYQFGLMIVLFFARRHWLFIELLPGYPLQLRHRSQPHSLTVVFIPIRRRFQQLEFFFQQRLFLSALCDGKDVAYAGVGLLLRKLFYLINAPSSALLISSLRDVAGNLIIYRGAVF